MNDVLYTYVENVKYVTPSMPKNNAVLIQQIYPNTPGVEMLEMQVERNQAYCDSWGIDYQYWIVNPIPNHDPVQGSWAKVYYIEQALIAGYDYVIWLDADTIIRDFETDLRDGCVYGHIGACWQRIPQLHHWNVGALFVSNHPLTLAFLRNWFEKFPGGGPWNEQGCFNELAMQSKVVQTISDRWNATFNYTECPDTVILGYHGAGNTQQRIELMKSVLKELEK
jgi:hypothetical protein